ncbi:MAG: AzlC family ABC transporter permease [Trueperaceae bacterium]|nr:AzlC family ABC transporter permease [Trueperaceae bacterium]
MSASPTSGGFGAGFRAMVPLWMGVAPFGAAYAVTARAAGIDPVHTQLMSLLVFAGGAQFAAVGLIAAGAGPWTLISTTFLLNLRHLLYGVVVASTTELRGGRRLLAAHLLTDEAFGVHVAHGRGRPAFLIGAGLSLFVVWNAATLVGSLLARSLPEPHAIGLDIVFPLAFLALLVPLLHDHRTLAVAAIAGLGAWGLGAVLEPGAALLVAATLAAAIGAALPAAAREAP